MDQEAVMNLELEMMTDVFNKMSQSCIRKCISTKFREPDITKGEAVCLDRCANKFHLVHELVGQKLVDTKQQ